MSVPWEYFPVRIVVRDGQHSGLTTNASLNLTPLPISSCFTVGIRESSSKRWSSVRISTMFGGAEPELEPEPGLVVSERAMPAAAEATTDQSATIRSAERERRREREMSAPPSWPLSYPTAQPLRRAGG